MMLTSGGGRCRSESRDSRNATTAMVFGGGGMRVEAGDSWHPRASVRRHIGGRVSD